LRSRYIAVVLTQIAAMKFGNHLSAACLRRIWFTRQKCA
jgi:hypothetical protein